MKAPAITVLMPAYNAEKYIAEAIHSILIQSFADFELLVINNGSTDSTTGVVRKFADPRISLIEEPQQGVGFALNTGLKQAEGIYIARFDADDICNPGRLEKQYELLQKNPEYVLCGSDAEYIAENGEHLFHFDCIAHTHEEIIEQLHRYCPFIHSSVMYRKEAVLNAGNYSTDAHNFEDYLLWIQLAKSGRYFNIPERLIKVRFNPSSATIDEKWRGYRFRRFKKKIIQKGTITPEEGKKLLSIIHKRDHKRIREASYYALCGKKFLINNHQPSKAREHLAKSIKAYPLRPDNYALFILSYFPQPVISWLNNKIS